MSKKSALLAVLLATGLAAAAFAADQVVIVHNLTGYDLSSLYITPTQAETWGDDLTGGQPLVDGDSMNVTFTISNNDWYWDMRATDTQGDTVVWHNIDLQGVSNLYLWVDKDGVAEEKTY